MDADPHQVENALAEHGVIFSYPLDLDMMMIRAFPDAYEVDETLVPKDTTKLEASVFGKGGGLPEYVRRAPDADHPSMEELATYDRLFKKRSKPGSHIEALSKLTDEDIVADCPQPLRDLIDKAEEILRDKADDDEE